MDPSYFSTLILQTGSDMDNGQGDEKILSASEGPEWDGSIFGGRSKRQSWPGLVLFRAWMVDDQLNQPWLSSLMPHIFSFSHLHSWGFTDETVTG
jgi:hypothetical protein